MNKRTSLETKDLKEAITVKFNEINCDVSCLELDVKERSKREMRRKLVAQIEEILENLEDKLK